QETGKYAVQYAEKVLPEIEVLLDYKLNRRIEVLVYNDLSDLNQTNIGQSTESFNIGGHVKIIHNKVFIYFDGNHKNLEKHLRQGMAQVMISHMMMGGNFQEVVQNVVLLNLPMWFVGGLVEYVGEPWSSTLDDKLKDLILTGKFKKMKKLEMQDAVFYGHAFWHYVEEKYGATAISNLLFLTRTN